MRRAYSDIGWMLDEQGRTVGLGLGYDFCAEHEFGISGILSAFGVQLPEFPLGVGDRQVRQTPERLSFFEYDRKPRDKRRKAQKAAALGLGVSTPEDLGRIRDGVDFMSEPGDSWNKPEHDIATAWNASGFVIHVRGQDNIARLKELHEAFQRLDVAVALPWARSFFRGGLSFVIASRMSDEQKAEVLAKDQTHLELHQAAAATGVKELLKSAGKSWYALSPAWLDDHKDEVIFFLNPCSQDRYNHGWFTVSELQDWALYEQGPVVKDQKLQEFAQLPENKDYQARLLRGLNQQGIGMRYGTHLVWCDPDRKRPGISLRVTRECEDKLASGVYPFDELMARYATPVEAPGERVEA